MLTTTMEALQNGEPIAIVEDDQRNARAIGWALDELEFKHVWISPDPAGVDSLLKKVKSKAVAVISDHRLTKGASIPYYGAELVALSNKGGLPAVLITSYANSDENSSIRVWRANIPRLLNRGTDISDPETILTALTEAAAECSGEYRLSRQAFATVVRIKDLRAGPAGNVAEVIITSWRPAQTVDMPMSMIYDSLGYQAGSMRGLRFNADVNIYAEDAGELYFRDIRPAASVPAEWLS